MGVAAYFSAAHGAPTALVVDDDPKARRRAARMLEREGIAPTCCSSVAEARAALAVHGFDLVVSELRLGDGMGADLTEELGRLAPDTATILTDGTTTDESASTALAAGVDDYLTKPFSSEELAIAVTRALRRRAERTASNLSLGADETETPERSHSHIAEDVLDCLIRAGRFRDEETSEHVERVSRTCALLAHQIGWSAVDCGTLRAASAMHDIGKVGVPDAVLRKPGSLTPNERARIERHAPMGYEILSGSGDPVLEMAATIALSHHERIDGEGYPNGLAGEDIPLCGRITAVADVFDALTHDRVYRAALTVEAALEIMQQGAGTQFDTRVLAALIPVLPQVEQVGMLYRDAEKTEAPPADALEEALRVLIVEDHGAIARGLALLFRREGMEVVGTATSVAEAERLIETRAADVAVLDVNLDGESGFSLIPKAHERGVLVLLYTGGATVLPDSAAHHPDGTASKSGGPTELIRAIREVAAGRAPRDSRVEQEPVPDTPPLLTAREREISALLAQGLSGEGIAERLFLSPHTVRTHVRNAMAKTNANTRAHLVAIAAGAGEIPVGA
jgi:putative two-component system response regulator